MLIEKPENDDQNNQLALSQYVAYKTKFKCIQSQKLIKSPPNSIQIKTRIFAIKIAQKASI